MTQRSFLENNLGIIVCFSIAKNARNAKTFLSLCVKTETRRSREHDEVNPVAKRVAKTYGVTLLVAQRQHCFGLQEIMREPQMRTDSGCRPLMQLRGISRARALSLYLLLIIAYIFIGKEGRGERRVAPL